ncbi:hypothetical protein JXA85_02350 [Candidatus Woesearchaeota archaeon]|nr:hypothetical protein [Candidatus Woesearchaeota archaeon]
MKSFREKILGIAIALVFVFFVAYGLHTFFKDPKWENYCNTSYKEYFDKDQCEATGGRWTEDAMPRPVMKESLPVNITGWCDPNYVCQQEFDRLRNNNNFIASMVAIAIGTAAIVVGAIAISLEPVAFGMMAGGVLTIGYGVLRYWSEMKDLQKFLTMGFVLALLIWLAYKKMKK